MEDTLPVGTEFTVSTSFGIVDNLHVQNIPVGTEGYVQRVETITRAGEYLHVKYWCQLRGKVFEKVLIIVLRVYMEIIPIHTAPVVYGNNSIRSLRRTM